MNTPMIKLAGLYEKTSAKGTRYFVGRLNSARLLMFANTDQPARSPGLVSVRAGTRRAQRQVSAPPQARQRRAIVVVHIYHNDIRSMEEIPSTAKDRSVRDRSSGWGLRYAVSNNGSFYIPPNITKNIMATLPPHGPPPLAPFPGVATGGKHPWVGDTPLERFALWRARQRHYKRWRKVRALVYQKFLALIQKRGADFFRHGNHPRNAEDLNFDYWPYRFFLKGLMQEHPFLYQLREKGRKLKPRSREPGVLRTPMIPARIRRAEQAKKRQQKPKLL